MTGGYDIIIAGGGMIGATLACALDGLGLKVAVIEASAAATSADDDYDERSTAIAPVSQRIFGAVGVWPALAPVAAPIRDIHVSRQGHFGVTRLAAAELQVPALGYVVPNSAITAALEQRLADCPDVTMVRPARVTAVRYPEQGIEVVAHTADGEQTLHARLLVAADGTLSPCRELLGIPVNRRHYGQTAIVANITPQQDHRGRAFERFTGNGPLALLPLRGGRAALVWTVPEAQTQHWMQCDDSEFTAALEQRLGRRLGRIERVGRRQAWPLALVRAQRLTAPHALVVGNAAHTLHPVAGQGFNLGMRDVAVLAEYAAAGAGIGDADFLDRWARCRQSDHQRLVGFSDALVRLFGADWPGLAAARSAGLLGLDLCSGGKRAFTRAAMGLGPDMPRLSRGLPLREMDG